MTVRSGVSAGDVVITAGVHKLLAGEVVRLAPEVERAMGLAARTESPAPATGG